MPSLASSSLVLLAYSCLVTATGQTAPPPLTPALDGNPTTSTGQTAPPPLTPALDGNPTTSIGQTAPLPLTPALDSNPTTSTGQTAPPPLTPALDNNLTTSDSCPPSQSLNNTNCTVKCNDKDDRIVKCEGKAPGLQLRACYCYSHYPELNRTVVGNCLYSCALKHVYKAVPDINEACNKFSRTGRLCSQCKDGTGHPLYSYSMECVPCDHAPSTLLKYLAAAFLPLTLFYLLVVLFRVSATAENLSGYITMSQLLTMPSQLRYMSALQYGHRGGQTAINVAIGLHAVWNLDFFRSMYRPFCYRDSTDILLVTSLDYVVGLYPLFLILLTYLLISLHDRCPPLSQAWKPVRTLVWRVRRRWQVRRSLVDAFATFLLLSYIKILNVTFDLLMPTTLRDIDRPWEVVSRRYLYYDGSREILCGGHVAYAVLAMGMSLVFNVLPLLLLLCYPCPAFQRLLNLCTPTRLHRLLHAFMDAFQGCYRTEPLDCRYFAAVGLLARVANLVFFSLTLSRYYFHFTCLLLVTLGALTALLRPYRSQRQNTIDTVLFMVFAFGYANASAYALSPEQDYNTLLSVLMGLSVLVSLGYMATLLLHTLLVKSQLLGAARKLCARVRGGVGRGHCDDDELFESLRGRDETRPLLHASVGYQAEK